MDSVVEEVPREEYGEECSIRDKTHKGDVEMNEDGINNVIFFFLYPIYRIETQN